MKFIRCQACPADSEVPATAEVTYGEPSSARFVVCNIHAAEAVAAGAVATTTEGV